MEGIKPKPLQRAISKLMFKAVEEIEYEEQNRRAYELAMMQAKAQHTLWSQNPYQQVGSVGLSNTTTTSAGQTLGGAITTGTTWINPQLGGGFPQQQYGQQGPLYPTPRPTLTDEQMDVLIEKMAHALAKGWECTRCHRIWSPREVGCEFCNFIDRLEGKDVDRDTAA